jgi:hypothetical protein
MKNIIKTILWILIIHNSKAQSDFKSCVYANLQEIDIQSDTSKLFLSGELHYFKNNEQIQFDMLKHLYELKNVRVLLIEGGYSMGIVLNNFITGKDSVWERMASLNSDLIFYKKIRELNRILPDSNRIKIEGIDLSSGDNFFLMPALKSLWPNKLDKESELKSIQTIKKLFQELEPLNWLKSTNTDIVFNALKYDLENNENEFKLFWGNNFQTVKNIIETQAKSRGIYDDKNASRGKFDQREIFMFSKIKMLYHQYPNVSFYGQFGRAHISKVYMKKWFELTDWNSFASMLNNDSDSPFRGKVSTYFIYYPKRRKDRKSRLIKSLYESFKNSNIDFKTDPYKLIDCKCLSKSNLYYNPEVDFILVNKY